MFLLESPAVSDGLQAWEKWERHLADLGAKHARDESIKSERARAERMIRMFRQQPDGMHSSDPRFKAVLRALQK